MLGSHGEHNCSVDPSVSKMDDAALLIFVVSCVGVGGNSCVLRMAENELKRSSEETDVPLDKQRLINISSISSCDVKEAAMERLNEGASSGVGVGGVTGVMLAFSSLAYSAMTR